MASSQPQERNDAVASPTRVRWFRRWRYRHFAAHRCECACKSNWGGPCGPCVCGR